MGLAFKEPDAVAPASGGEAPSAALAPALSEAATARARRDRRGPLRPRRLAPARLRLRRWTLRAIFRIADLAALSVCAPLAAFLAWRLLGAPAGTPLLASFAAASAVLFWALGAFDSYGLGLGETLPRHLSRLVAALGLSALALGLIVSGFGLPAGATPMELWIATTFAALFCLHILYWRCVRAWRSQGRLTPNIVVVGANAGARTLIERLAASGEAAVLGVFDDRLGRAPADIAGVPVLGDVAHLVGHPLTPFVDRIVITVPSLARSRVSALIERLAVLPNEIMLVIDHDAGAFSRIVGTPLARLAGPPSDERRALVKRAADIVIGSAALLLALPAMALVAIAIRLDSPGPILFRQRRQGFNNEAITVLKFRSMHAAASLAAVCRAERQVDLDDPRVTRVGRFIRRTSLDELPQLFNVLRGEMSLVGPRPHALGMKTGEVESCRLVAGYAHRHRLKPGVTGWAAIHGSRGPVATAEAVRRRVALDIEYIERQSFWLDLHILAMTLPCLLGDGEQVR